MQASNTICTQLHLVDELSDLIPQYWTGESIYEQTIDPELARRYSVDGRALIESRRYQLSHEGRHDIRVAKIHSGNADILNVLLFPDQPEWQPLLVVDLFCQRGQVRALFIDLPYTGSHANVRVSVSNEMQQWSTQGVERCPAPHWATRYSTSHYIFSRDLVTVDRSPFALLMTQAIDSWTRLVELMPSGQDDRCRENLERFKKEHLHEAPNEKYLAAIFGREWTTRYLGEFLYQ